MMPLEQWSKLSSTVVLRILGNRTVTLLVTGKELSSLLYQKKA